MAVGIEVVGLADVTHGVGISVAAKLGRIDAPRGGGGELFRGAVAQKKGAGGLGDLRGLKAEVERIHAGAEDGVHAVAGGRGYGSFPLGFIVVLGDIFRTKNVGVAAGAELAEVSDRTALIGAEFNLPVVLGGIRSRDALVGTLPSQGGIE